MSDTLDLARLEKLLRDEAANWRCGPVVTEAADALRYAASRISELESALRPFADAANVKLCGEWKDDEHFGRTDVQFYLTFGHLRQARSVLGEKA